MNRPRLTFVGILATIALGGCAAFTGTTPTDDDRNTSTDDASAAPLSVEASFYPLQFLAEEIGGDRLEVSALTPPGVDPHHLELSPRAVSDLSASDLVVYLSGFQPAVDEAVPLAGARAFDAAQHTSLREVDGDDHAHDHGDEGHEHEHEHGNGLHDPHFWLDPVRFADVAQALADELSALDPDGTSTYAENADQLTSELTNLQEDLTDGLTQCERKTIVVAHEAYGYLTDPHGLSQEGLSGLDPDAEPSPARLAEIADVVSGHGVDTIFVEALLSPRVVETLAEDLGVRTAVLDPLENQQDPSSDYLAVMRTNLGVLQDALSCEAV